MASTGIDRRTGRIITDFDHVLQSIGVVVTTQVGERVMREWVGNPGFRFLGEPLNNPNIIKLLQLMTMILSMRQLNGLAVEPRFSVTRAAPILATRSGNFECRLDGIYIPRGHLGDPTPYGEKSVLLTGREGVYTATEIV